MHDSWRGLCYVQAMTTVPCFTAVWECMTLGGDYVCPGYDNSSVLMQCESAWPWRGLCYVQAIRTTVPCFNAVWECVTLAGTVLIQAVRAVPCFICSGTVSAPIKQSTRKRTICVVTGASLDKARKAIYLWPGWREVWVCVWGGGGLVVVMGERLVMGVAVMYR